MYNNSKHNKDFLNGEGENLVVDTTLEQLDETQNNGVAISIKNLVKVLGVNSCIPIIRWIKAGEIQTTEELDGTIEILEKPIVIIESVRNFIEEEAGSYLRARNRRIMLDRIAWLDIKEHEIEE